MEADIRDIKINYRDNSTDIGVIKEVFFEDPYFISDIPNNSLVIDIGAHIGTFSLRCAKERNCTVYSYEPCEDSYRLLIENIRNNRLEDKIKAFRMAISSRNTSREFYVDRYHYSGSSFCLKESAEKKTFDRPYYPENVVCTTLGQIFVDNNLSKCDILKIDCEGEERNIFSSTSANILKMVDKMMLEYHLYVDGNEISKYLTNMGFSVFPEELPPVERNMLYATRK